MTALGSLNDDPYRAQRQQPQQRFLVVKSRHDGRQHAASDQQDARTSDADAPGGVYEVVVVTIAAHDALTKAKIADEPQPGGDSHDEGVQAKCCFVDEAREDDVVGEADALGDELPRHRHDGAAHRSAGDITHGCCRCLRRRERTRCSRR